MKQTTHDVIPHILERAVLVSLVTQKEKRNEFLTEYSLQELVALAETAGVEVLETMTQNKDAKDSKTFIGKGKVAELKLRLEELDGNTAIFDQELSGAQVRNLEAALDVKIIDRTQLILDIFAQRAKTREGILQVELAQLSYLLPRLSGQGKNLARLNGGGIGARGPGETKLEMDRRHIRDRIDELKQQMQEVVRHRVLHRERRKKAGAFQVALVGYTNAGKSTLLNQLTHADVYVQNQLFATLDPTSRNLKLPGGKEIILTDTVGFIQNLPHDLIASFRATLEEEWLDDFLRLEQHPIERKPAYAEIFSGINLKICYLRIYENKELVGLGSAVLEDEWAGFGNIITSQNHRNKGIGTRIVQELAQWSQLNGAEQLYLQVMRNNKAALNLYTRLGFTHVYDYHYRVRLLS